MTINIYTEEREKVNSQYFCNNKNNCKKFYNSIVFTCVGVKKRHVERWAEDILLVEGSDQVLLPVGRGAQGLLPVGRGQQGREARRLRPNSWGGVGQGLVNCRDTTIKCVLGDVFVGENEKPVDLK